MTSSLDLASVAKGALLGGVASGVLNVVLFYVGDAIGATYAPIDPAAMGGLERLLPVQPLLNCLIAAVISIGVLAVLAKVAPAKAWTIYLGVAVVVFLGELYAPFWAFADLKTIVMLELMHIPATVGIVGGIHRYAIRGPSALQGQ